MRIATSSFAAAFSVLFLISSIPSTVSASDLRVGVAELRITPPPGAPMAGYYHSRAATGTHDDLWAKAIVLEQDGVRAALVSCDLIELKRGIIDEARVLIERENGVPPQAVMLSATHAHTGPVILPEHMSSMPASMGRLAQEFREALPAQIAEVVRRATANLQPARVQAGVGREESISFNRRFFMKDGSVGWNPGKRNPNIARPAGPIDPDVPVVYFETADSKPLATYVSFALHLDTVGGLEYSADYPYTLYQVLGKVKSPEMLTMFTMGCSGNVNHIDVSSAAPQKGHAEAARIGTVLAGEVIKTYTRLNPVRLTERGLEARSRIVELPLAPIREDEVERSRAIVATFDQPNAAPFRELVHAFKVLDVTSRNGRPVEAEVQVIRLGRDLAWVGLPGEIFTELGMEIKRRSPFRTTIVVSLANGSIDYIPNRKAYPEGNYEVISARCAEGSGEMLVDTAVEMLEQAAR
jgi:neutral ceramidase